MQRTEYKISWVSWPADAVRLQLSQCDFNGFLFIIFNCSLLYTQFNYCRHLHKSFDLSYYYSGTIMYFCLILLKQIYCVIDQTVPVPLFSVTQLPTLLPLLISMLAANSRLFLSYNADMLQFQPSNAQFHISTVTFRSSFHCRHNNLEVTLISNSAQYLHVQKHIFFCRIDRQVCQNSTHSACQSDLFNFFVFHRKTNVLLLSPQAMSTIKFTASNNGA